MLANTLASLLGVSLTTGVIILLLALFSTRLNRVYAARWKHWAWLVLALRLLLPFNLSLPQAPLRMALPEAQIALPPLLQPAPASPAQQVTPVAAATGQTLSVIQLLGLLWLGGTLLFLLLQVLGYGLFRRQVLRWSRPVSDSRITEQLRALSAALGIKSQIVPLVSAKVSSPMMTGFVRPLLLLPHEGYTDRELAFVLKHELVHLKRHDLWFKLLLLLANAVHWFNPLAYLLVREASKDMELSCDDEVTRGASFAERKEYSQTILAALQRQVGQQTALSTYFHGGTRTMEERFRNILAVKAKRRGVVAFALVVASVLLVGGIVACSTPVAKDDPAAVVTKYLQAEKDNNYDAWESTLIEEKQQAFAKEANGVFGINSLTVDKVAVSDEETKRMKERYTGSDLAKSRGWTDAYIAENMIVVTAQYTVDYDNTLVPNAEGAMIQDFILVRASKTAPWLIWDSSTRPAS